MVVAREQRQMIAVPSRDLIFDTLCAHQQGNGQVSVARTLRVLGTLTAQDRARLEERGAFHLTATGMKTGCFMNKAAQEITINTPDAVLQIPRIMAGEYIIAPDRCELAFFEKAAMRARKYLFSLDVCRVVATLHSLSLSLGSGSQEIVYTF